MIDQDIENIYDMTLFEASDLEELLHQLLKQIKEITHAQAGSIYLVEGDYLKFHIFQNDAKSYEDIYKIYAKIKDHKILLNDNSYICAEAFNKAKIITVDDVYKSESFNFYDTKKFDEMIEYKTHSIITVPLVHPLTKEKLGVIQILNKIDPKTLEIIPFSEEDKQTVYNNSLFISISIAQLLNDMNTLQEVNKQLQKKIANTIKQNHDKDAIIHDNTKNISLGNLMNSIAHNWRQPLSTISILASGMMLKLDYEMLSDKELKDNLNQILSVTQDLSSLITTFNEFYDNNEEKSYFNVPTHIDKAYGIINRSLIQHDVEVIFDTDTSLHVSNYPNSFTQVMLSFFILHEEIFSQNDQKKILLIEVLEKDNAVIVNLKNNQKELKPSYLTSDTFQSSLNFKQSKPTLFLIKRIINHTLKAKLEYEIADFTVNGEEFTGTCFSIILPKQ